MILVFLSMFGVMFLITQYFQLILGFSPLGSALRFLPIAPVMLIVAPMTPRIVGRIGVNRTVGLGMSLVSIGFLSFTLLKVDTSYLYVLVCMLVLISGIALTISPMTAAIMSVVPPRRAGAGSAMNDATRELGAALGVAVLGSVAASRYSAGIAHAIAPLAPGDQATASASLGAALQTAGRLPQNLAGPLVSAAEHAFVDGIHLAAFTGSVLCARARRWPCSSSCPTRSSSTAPCTTRSRPPRTWPSSAWAVRCRSSPTPPSAIRWRPRARPAAADQAHRVLRGQNSGRVTPRRYGCGMEPGGAVERVARLLTVPVRRARHRRAVGDDRRGEGW